VEVNNDNLPKRESMLEIFEQKLPPGWSAHETDQGLVFFLLLFAFLFVEKKKPIN